MASSLYSTLFQDLGERRTDTRTVFWDALIGSFEQTVKRRVDGVMRASFDAESALTTARRSCGSMGVCRALAAISTARKAIAWKGTGISHHKRSIVG